MHTPPIKAASWVVLYDRGPVRVPDLHETRQDHVISVDLDRGCAASGAVLVAVRGVIWRAGDSEG